jgi:hypothetical protein
MKPARPANEKIEAAVVVAVVDLGGGIEAVGIDAFKNR